MKTVAVLLVTFGLFAHAGNQPACPHARGIKLDADTSGDTSSVATAGKIIKAKAKK